MNRLANELIRIAEDIVELEGLETKPKVSFAPKANVKIDYEDDSNECFMTISLKFGDSVTEGMRSRWEQIFPGMMSYSFAPLKDWTAEWAEDSVEIFADFEQNFGSLNKNIRTPEVRSNFIRKLKGFEKGFNTCITFTNIYEIPDEQLRRKFLKAKINYWINGDRFTM